jgi:serine O-acetyltransferase
MISPWQDALALARAAKRAGTARDAWRMMRTDAWFLLLLFRARELTLRLRIPVLNRVLRMLQMVFGGVELGNDIRLGPGVYFIHSLGTVVGSGATVGARVRFLGNNTVGSARDDGAPIIGDDVEIGCGARVLGPVRVGDRAVIGANAVVLCDVPADHVAVGAPARVFPNRRSRDRRDAVATDAYTVRLDERETFVGAGFHPPIRTRT